MSDAQRKYKERFEQKKIDDARKQAVLEKRKQKEVGHFFHKASNFFVIGDLKMIMLPSQKYSSTSNL